jgi:signal transduction histidine kinase
MVSQKNGETVTHILSEKAIPLPEGSLWRPGWFVTMRFFAVTGASLALLFTRFVLDIKTIDYSWLWFITFILFLTNILYFLYYRSSRLNLILDTSLLKRRFQRFTVLQINTDLIILTLLIHFSGGVTNPVFIFYFFHIIIGSILISKKYTYFEAFFAAILFNGTTVLEASQAIHHYKLFPFSFYSDPHYLVVLLSVFTFSLFMSVYLTATAMDRLRIHQVWLENSLRERDRLVMEKSHFLEVVAHDIRSPLSAIESTAISALDAYGGDMNPGLKDTIERIPKRTRELNRFVQNLLSFSQLRNMNEIKTHFKHINFLPIVTSTVEMYMDEALEKMIKMTVQAEPKIPLIIGSGEYLERMVGNLISNAIRYTPENGSVTVKVSHDEKDVILTVADTGIGVPEKELPKLFNEFFRASNARRYTTSGTGLGLPITRFIVENHSGTITANSIEGEGSVFTVRIPIAPAKQE